MIDELVRLKDYVPLFQTSIWIGFIIVILLIFKKPIREIVSILINRIKKGSSIKAGLFEIGEELKNMEYAKQVSSDSIMLTGTDGQKREEHRTKIYEKNKGLFLTHLIYPSDTSGQLFDIYIYLIRHKLDNFSDIEKAEFFFGHMWGNQVFMEKPRNGIIGISTSAYAPFLCTCCVRFKNGDEVQLDRYVDFEINKIYKKIK
jgi:hypothetical protein